MWYFQPLWGPIPFPSGPQFSNWHGLQLQLLIPRDIDNFVRNPKFKHELWFRVINLADGQLSHFELRAPWFSDHLLRQFHCVMHLVLSAMAICRSRANPDAQPGSTFLDSSMSLAQSPTAIYWWLIWNDSEQYKILLWLCWATSTCHCWSGMFLLLFANVPWCSNLHLVH